MNLAALVTTPFSTIARGIPVALISAAVLVMCGCGSKPAVKKGLPVTIEVQASKQLNRDPIGRPAPVLVRIYELKGIGEFESLDFFTLDSKAKERLAGDLIRVEELLMRPGEEQILEKRIDEATMNIGVVAGYRDLAKSDWRAVFKIPEAPDTKWYRRDPDQSVRLKIGVGDNAVSIEEVEQQQ